MSSFSPDDIVYHILSAQENDSFKKYRQILFCHYLYSNSSVL